MLTWQDFLQLASDPGLVSVAVGVILSVIVDYVPGFSGLMPRWKRAVFFGLSLVVPVVAAGLGVLTLDWSPSFIDTFWPAIVAGVVAFGSGTLTHLPKLPDFPVDMRLRLASKGIVTIEPEQDEP